MVSLLTSTSFVVYHIPSVHRGQEHTSDPNCNNDLQLGSEMCSLDQQFVEVCGLALQFGSEVCSLDLQFRSEMCCLAIQFGSELCGLALQFGSEVCGLALQLNCVETSPTI